jgi:tetratricopeptide (TPR) repeat protein
MAWIATGCVLALSRFNTHIWRTQERRLLLHIQSFLDIRINKALSLGSKAIVIPILLHCGFTLLDMRQDFELGSLLEGIFVELRQKPELPLAGFLPLYDLQARSLVNLGKNQKAVELLEQVAKIREAILAEDHPSRLASQHELAGAYQANGQVKDAVKLLKKVVKIQEAILAEDHPSQLASQRALAYYLRDIKSRE